MKLYLAASLFSVGEMNFNAELANELTKLGHEVVLPQDLVSASATNQEIFDVCKSNIDMADIVLAILEGSDPDSGTSWEVGYAYEKKPIIGIRTDFRVHSYIENNDQEENISDINPMLSKACNHFFVFYTRDSIADMARYLHNYIKEYES